jgi:flagellar biosynthesis/type III secretory pathway chaperone
MGYILGILGWLLLCIIVGAIGSERKVGFWGAFFLSFFFSPLIGLIITAFSQSKSDLKYKNDLLNIQSKQQDSLDKLSKHSDSSKLVSELSKFKELLDKGIIDNQEFERLKQRTLEKFENADNIQDESELIHDIDVKVDRLYELIKEAKTNNFKNDIFLRGAIMTLSWDKEINNVIEYYKTKYQTDLYNDIITINAKAKKINYVIEPLVAKGVFEKV